MAKRQLTQEEKKIAADLIRKRELERDPNGSVTVSIADKSDEDGNPKATIMRFTEKVMPANWKPDRA